MCLESMANRRMLIANVSCGSGYCLAGDVPRVDGQLAVARAFGDKSLKVHLSAHPDIRDEFVDSTADCFILASDGLWKVCL